MRLSRIECCDRMIGQCSCPAPHLGTQADFLPKDLVPFGSLTSRTGTNDSTETDFVRQWLRKGHVIE